MYMSMYTCNSDFLPTPMLVFLTIVFVFRCPWRSIRSCIFRFRFRRSSASFPLCLCHVIPNDALKRWKPSNCALKILGFTQPDTFFIPCSLCWNWRKTQKFDRFWKQCLPSCPSLLQTWVTSFVNKNTKCIVLMLPNADFLCSCECLKWFKTTFTWR